MNGPTLKTQSLYGWLIVSLFFWVCLACFEASVTIITKALPAPLGRGSLPSAIDLRYLIAACSIYGLISIPAALILWIGEKIFSRLMNRATYSLFNLNRMDILLLFGFGTLCFKWISNLMAYLTDAEHLPSAPYLLIVPLLGLQLWITSRVKKTGGYYKVAWICLILATILFSKTGYDLVINASISIAVRVLLLVSAVGVGLGITLIPPFSIR